MPASHHWRARPYRVPGEEAPHAYVRPYATLCTGVHMVCLTLAGAILSEVLATTAIGMLFLGESTSALKILGVLLVIAGVVVLNLDGAH
ncbi:hypothetical protein SAMN05428945_3718 [Streptomyces sp. 2224.1]|nr:hypothetical protein SAMN05428945_3718 [Streptomyces sp. 2224.1]